MEQTIMREQTSTTMSAESMDNADILTAKILIGSKTPRFVRQGIKILIKLHDRQMKSGELAELSAFLLANRRKAFIKQLEEKSNHEQIRPSI
jgi:hypothetical protein